MFRNRLFILVLTTLLLLGCASARKMNSLSLGMTREEVIEVMGSPDSTSEIEDILYLKYRLSSGGIYKDDYYVRLKDGEVDAYGREGNFGLGY